MTYRIITHAGCTDGFCTAFVFKRYLAPLLNVKGDIKILPVLPSDIELGEIEFTTKDIVLDLPCPKKEVFFWCDHHSTNKPKEEKKNYHWKIAPSCCSYLLDIAFSLGLKKTAKLVEFQKVLDTIDAAQYTKDEYMSCYYPPKDFRELSTLQQAHVLSTMFQTRDYNLNSEMFRSLLSFKLKETPFVSSWFKKMQPLIFFKAHLKSYQEWRDHVDTYIYYDKETKCVVQDDRKILKRVGLPDRFYAFAKFSQSTYSLNFKPLDEKQMRIGIGSNIFHKDRCKIDIGALCKEVGKKFGEGSGGGHKEVGGARIFLDKADAALKFILARMKEGE
jgi:hypothetical protein